MAPNYITLRGLERVRRELLWLEKEERPKIVAEVAWAASLGDRSENAEYIYGKKRLRQIDGRRRYLIKRLEIARPVDLDLMGGERVTFGATVVVANADGEETTWKLYGEDEVDVAGGVLSWRSPLGRALTGKEAGDEVTFQAPGGRRTLEVVEVRFEPQPPLPDDLTFSR
jgi:transcription elongation factor GreB